MSKAFVADLEQSRDLKCGIEIITATGQRHITGVVDLDAEENWVRIRSPQHFGDEETTTVLLITDIAQVTLHTDMAYD